MPPKQLRVNTIQPRQGWPGLLALTVALGLLLAACGDTTPNSPAVPALASTTATTGPITTTRPVTVTTGSLSPATTGPKVAITLKDIPTPPGSTTKPSSRPNELAVYPTGSYTTTATMFDYYRRTLTPLGWNFCPDQVCGGGAPYTTDIEFESYQYGLGNTGPYLRIAIPDAAHYKTGTLDHFVLELIPGQVTPPASPVATTARPGTTATTPPINVPPTFGGTPSAKGSLAVPKSVADIPVPPEIIKKEQLINDVTNSSINIFPKPGEYTKTASLFAFYRRVLPPLGWNLCPHLVCTSNPSYITDFEYESYQFGEGSTGPFLWVSIRDVAHYKTGTFDYFRLDFYSSPFASDPTNPPATTKSSLNPTTLPITTKAALVVPTL